MVTEQGSSAELPSGCSVRVQVNSTHSTAHVFFNSNSQSAACCGSGVDTINGSQKSLVNLSLTVSSQHGVTITMSGPDSTWFGVGFNTHGMANSPYTITVDGEGKVTERVLADHSAGIVLNTSVNVIQHSAVDGKRTVVMTRPLKGLTPHHHDFDIQQLSLDFISATGATADFSYHKDKTVGTIALWPQTTGAAQAPPA